MNKNKDVASNEAVKETCEFIQGLPEENFRRLLSSPVFGHELLEHASFCDQCGPRVEAALKAMFESLPADEKEGFYDYGRRFVAEHFRGGEDEGHESYHNTEVPSLGQTLKPGNLIRFRGVSDYRRIKEIKVGFGHDPSKWINIPIAWETRPAVASGGSALLPTIPQFTLEGTTFELAQGHSDANTNETTFRLKLLKGRKYPIPEVQVVLVVDTGVLIKSEVVEE